MLDFWSWALKISVVDNWKSSIIILDAKRAVRRQRRHYNRPRGDYKVLLLPFWNKQNNSLQEDPFSVDEKLRMERQTLGDERNLMGILDARRRKTLGLQSIHCSRYWQQHHTFVHLHEHGLSLPGFIVAAAKIQGGSLRKRNAWKLKGIANQTRMISFFLIKELIYSIPVA